MIPLETGGIIYRIFGFCFWVDWLIDRIHRLPPPTPKQNLTKPTDEDTTTAGSTTMTPQEYANARLAALAARELLEETAGTVKIDPGRLVAATWVDTGIFHRCVWFYFYVLLLNFIHQINVDVYVCIYLFIYTPIHPI
jgi:hypothetical protein